MTVLIGTQNISPWLCRGDDVVFVVDLLLIFYRTSSGYTYFRTKEYYEQGYRQVVDIDLAKYFDTVNHDLLIDMVREQVTDERIIKLIPELPDEKSHQKRATGEIGVYFSFHT